MRSAVLAVCALPLLGSRVVVAQEGNVPPEPKSFVVDVLSYFEGSKTPTQGAGVLFGAGRDTLYIVTAAHVLQRDTTLREVWVKFVSGDSVPAIVAHPKEGELDLAVLGVAMDASRLARWTPLSWDRKGDPGKLVSGDPVHPVGCPRSRCWGTPVPSDFMIGKDGPDILFQSSFVGPGMSGGALFNTLWEIVGVVIKHEPERANAIRMDRALRQVDAWGFPVTLKRPAIPRAWYHTTVGAAILASSSSGGGTGETRAPSGRATITRQSSRRVSWHLAGLRLAPKNLAVTAGMGGVGLHLRAGRLAWHPFVEAGFGHVEARFDRGGYFVATGSGTRYVPSFERVSGDGLGVGGGMNVQAVLLPPVIFEITAGYWSFTRPQNAPKLTNVFIGGGLRLGL